MVLITIVTGAYKPTYNWGASHCMTIRWNYEVDTFVGQHLCFCWWWKYWKSFFTSKHNGKITNKKWREQRSLAGLVEICWTITKRFAIKLFLKMCGLWQHIVLMWKMIITCILVYQEQNTEWSALGTDICGFALMILYIMCAQVYYY